MRQTIIASWCDPCVKQERRTDGRTVNLYIDGEAKSIELCPKHEQQLLGPLQVLMEAYGVDLKGRAATAVVKHVQPPLPEPEFPAPSLFPPLTPPKAVAGEIKEYECPSCGKKYDKRNSFVYHLRAAEGVGQSTETTCPDCGKEFASVNQCSTHRTKNHGFDGVESMVATLNDMMSGASKRKAG